VNPERQRAGRRLFRYLGPYRWVFALGVLTTALASALDGATVIILIPLFKHLFGSAGALGVGGTALEAWVNRVLDPLLGGPTGLVTARLVLLLWLGILIKNAMAYASAQLSVRVQEGMVRNLRIDLFDHLLRLDLGFFQRVRAGQIVARMT